MHERTHTIYKNFWMFISGTVILLVISLFLYLDIMQKDLKAEMRDNITEVARMEADSLDTKLKDEAQTIKALAGIMTQYYTITDIDTFLDILNEENNNNDFMHMGIIMPNGDAYFHDHSLVKDFMPKDNLDQLFDGKTITAAPIKNPSKEQSMVVTASPIFVYGKPQAAIFATHPTNYYEKILEISKLGGHGYSYVINENGDIIINASHPTACKAPYTGVLFKFDMPMNPEKFSKSLKQRESGVIGFYKDDQHKFMAYIPLAVNDWFLLFVVPIEPFMARLNQVMLMSIALCVEIILLFSIMMFYIKNTETKSKEALFMNAFIDPLTECGNINKFKMDLTKILTEYKEDKFALIALDIDKFKVVNELYGFRQGDMVLIHIANVLKEKLSDKEPFARMASDKFLFTINFVKDEEIESRVNEIYSEIKNCYAATDFNYDINANFGAFIIERNLPFFLMLDRAHIAIAEAKKEGKSHFAFYRDLSIKKILTEKSIENSMREALQNNQFKIFFQPKVNLQTMKMDGAEILVRWQHPSKGLIMPDVFIPIFERNGFILDLDMFMLKNAAQELRACLDAGLEPVRLAVNFSRLHVNNPTFCEEFKQTADFYKIPSNLLEAEITETTVLENLDKMKAVIEDFHKNGYLISVDDFGAGYSSLNVLKDLHFDTLKLDKEFLKTEGDKTRAKDIISGTVKMLKSLNSSVVAEGVETAAQAHFLKDIGCDKGQGYLFSKPIPIEHFREMLKNNDFSKAFEQMPEENQLKS